MSSKMRPCRFGPTGAGFAISFTIARNPFGTGATEAALPSADDAAKVVAGLMDPVPSGSYLAISHLASDLDPSLPAALKQWEATDAVPITLRSSAEIVALVTGLDLVPPGLVAANDWRPDESDPPGAPPVPLYGLLARKP